MLVYIDGQYLPREQAKISVFDHGFLYGDGVFEGIRAYHGRVFKLKEHITRLFESAHHLLLQIPLTEEEMAEVTLEVLRRNNLRDAYIRTVVSRGRGDLGLDPRKCPQPTVVVIADNITLFPPQYYERGLAIITATTRQRSADTQESRIKSLNYLNNILVKMEASQAGAMEAVVLNARGYVVEGSGSNIFIVNKKGELLTPPPYLGILEGVTRNTVIALAGKEGLVVREIPFTRHDLYIARECFLTGTAAELIPVISIDKRLIGDGSPGPLTKMLMQRFQQYARQQGTPVDSSAKK